MGDADRLGTHVRPRAVDRGAATFLVAVLACSVALVCALIFVPVYLVLAPIAAALLAVSASRRVATWSEARRATRTGAHGDPTTSPHHRTLRGA